MAEMDDNRPRTSDYVSVGATLLTFALIAFMVLGRVTALIPLVLPIWIPIVFGAYALARRQFSWLGDFAFITLEGMSLALARWAAGYMNFNADPH